MFVYPFKVKDFSSAHKSSTNFFYERKTKSYLNRPNTSRYVSTEIGIKKDKEQNINKPSEFYIFFN